MNKVNIHEAKTNLSKLLTLVEAGEDVIIARNGKEIARLTAVNPPQKKSRGYGAWKHLQGKIPDSFFFDPLPDDELEAFEGKYGFDP
jgi:prevent-host-death family protein